MDVVVRVGHGGRWAAGATTPVVVSLRNSGSDPVTVRIALSEAGGLSGGATRHSRDAFLAPRAQRREVFLLPGPARYGSGPQLDVSTRPAVPVHNRDRTASKGRMQRIEALATGAGAAGAVPAAARIVGSLFDERGVLAARLPEAAPDDLLLRAYDLRTVEAVAVDPGVLALAPFALDGLDSLVVLDPGADFCADPADLDGLLDWVALGGFLVISPGSDAGALVSSPVAAHLPATWGRAARAPYGEIMDRVRTEFGAPEDEVRPPRRLEGTWLPLRPRPGATLGPAARGPLWVDARLGLGRIRVLAFDVRTVLDASSGENEAQALATLLAGRPLPLPPNIEEHLAYYTGLDVDGSVAVTLRQDAFEPPPLPLVLLGLGLYVLVVGPLDWFVLKRLRKERLTTLTFAGAVAAFTTLAYSASFLVFSSGAVVNRIVVVDLADAGRDGRQVMRLQDLAGYYSPSGADRVLVYPMPAVIMPGRLPGSATGSDALTTEIRGSDPVRPDAQLLVSFRSQRAVRAVLAGATGRTIETSWDADGETLHVTNGLAIDLEEVLLLLPDGSARRLGPVASGADSTGGYGFAAPPGQSWVNGNVTGLERDPDGEEVRDLLGLLSRSSAVGADGRYPGESGTGRLQLDQQVTLAKSGIGRGSALAGGRALLIAFASRAPVALPGDDAEGRTHVVIRKEIDLP